MIRTQAKYEGLRFGSILALFPRPALLLPKKSHDTDGVDAVSKNSIDRNTEVSQTNL